MGHQPSPLRVRGLTAWLNDGERHLWLIQQRLPDDAPRVILTRIELLPIHIVEIRTHLLAKTILGAIGHIPQAAHKAPELRGVVRNPLWTQQKHRNHDDHDHLVET